jgi:hypothetical protein
MNMTPAPPFDCWLCCRRIGKTAQHYLLRGAIAQVCCGRCIDKNDAYDEVLVVASRAAMANRLELWS